MLSVDEAIARIIAACRAMPAEQLALSEARGRVLAETVTARLTKPPFDCSAMDGYAVRAADVASVPATLRLKGVSHAGHGFDGAVGGSEAVRIFTGAPLPQGADTILIQENASAEGTRVIARETVAKGRHIRRAGIDFRTGDPGPKAGTRLDARAIALTAAMNVPWVRVHRRPRVAVIATGDEIVMPGEPVGPGQIVSANSLALVALVAEAGAEPMALGIARDTPDSLLAAMKDAVGADLILLTGGASVGDHDLVRPVLIKAGLELDFWSIAMRPGKPLVFGRYGGVPLIGLPGNPVSTLVCGLLFVRPAIAAMAGLPAAAPALEQGVLGRDVGANDRRQEYLRASLTRERDGPAVITPFDRQDSSMLSTLAEAGALAVRAPNAPAAKAGDPIAYLPL
jgi:molybdopterin molybdotransferase